MDELNGGLALLFPVFKCLFVLGRVFVHVLLTKGRFRIYKSYFYRNNF